MKTKNTRSPGSLLVRGENYYAFWRVKGTDGKTKAICRALRDENGAAITTKPEAEKAKARLMEIVSKQNEVASLRSIQHAIDDKQAEIDRLKDEQNPPLALAQAWPAFLRSTERHDCGKSTLVMYESCWSRFEAWAQREYPEAALLRDISPDIAKAYLESMNHGKIAPRTFNAHLHFLRYFFRVLTTEARLTENVWKKAKSKADIILSRRDLTVDELKKVCDTAQGEMKLLFAIGLYTGLRLGDVATLKWGEVDLKRHQIRRVPNKTARRMPQAITIPIHAAIAAMLADIPANERDAVYVLPQSANTYLKRGRSKLTRQIQKHFEACGIKTTEEREVGSRARVVVGFHSLRHTFVSMAREAGAPLAVIEGLVGHHSVSLTRHYTHVSEAASQNAIGLLPSLNGEAAALATIPARDKILRELIESMSAKNWREKKSAALAMLADATAN
jgi:integrase